MAELEQENPNIRQQLVDWRMARVNNGENPFDYEAFRQHLIAIGAPDPGEEEISDFRYE
jgi:cytochrome c556